MLEDIGQRFENSEDKQHKNLEYFCCPQSYIWLCILQLEGVKNDRILSRRTAYR